jgi:MFS family permease
MAIPAYCLLVGNGLFVISYLRLPFAIAYPLEVIGFLVTTMAIPALRAGLTDAVPHNLRGSGFGFFNLASVILGQGVASLIVFPIAGAFSDNYRVAFLILSPPVFIGALILFKARDHLDADAAKIFEAIVTALQEQQRLEAERAAANADAPPANGGEPPAANADAVRSGPADGAGDAQARGNPESPDAVEISLDDNLTGGVDGEDEVSSGEVIAEP